MDNGFSKKKIIIFTIVTLNILILVYLVYIASNLYRKEAAYRTEAAFYKECITNAVNEFNIKEEGRFLKKMSLDRYPPNYYNITGYLGKYIMECENPASNIYEGLSINVYRAPFWDLSNKFEHYKDKGGDYKKAEFNSNCVFYQVSKAGITLECYKGDTEYNIRTYPIPDYDRDEIKIREDLREIHEIIWRQLD